ncbi:MAG TPA: tetratricopeptide repeat protein [Thermoanaerobaculia bacterium]|nr:tetratricopeptide repeat protein [Thermoanaerobaculia bacterium]
MRNVGAILTLAFAAGWPLAAQTEPTPSEYQNVDVERVRQYRDATAAYERARESFDRKDFEGTRKELGVCFQRIPAYPDAHLLLAKILYLEKDYAQALKEVERARAGHQTLAMSLASVQEARLSEMRARIRESSDLATALFGWGINWLEPEGKEIERIRSAQRSDPNELPAEYSFFHGNVLFRLGRTAEAAAQYEEALRAQTGYSDAANNLAALYFGERQNEKALAVVSKAEASGATVNPELKKAIETGLRQGG